MKPLWSPYEASINAAFRAPPKRAPAYTLLALLRYFTYFTQVLTLEKRSCSALTTTLWVFFSFFCFPIFFFFFHFSAVPWRQPAGSFGRGTQIICLTGTKVQILTQTCLTGTKVQILAQRALLGVERMREQAYKSTNTDTVKILVQKCKYWRKRRCLVWNVCASRRRLASVFVLVLVH